MSIEDKLKGWVKNSLPKGLSRQIRSVYRLLRSQLRERKRAGLAPLTAHDLAGDLRAGGIKPGDIVIVHSALSKLGNIAGGAAGVVASLQEALTPEGTLLMPTFGDAKTVFEDADRGVLTDLRNAPSVTGKIPDALRAAPGSYRSSHPFSSVCAWGKQAAYVTSGHAEDPGITHGASPIGRLWELGGKVVGLGVTLGPVSFYHVVEDTWDAFPLPVYLPGRPITYIDAAGQTITRDVRRFDPVVSRTRIDHPEGAWIRDRLTEHLIRKGIYRPFRYGEADAWVMDARPFYDEMKRLAQKGITIYLTKEQWDTRNEPLTSW